MSVALATLVSVMAPTRGQIAAMEEAAAFLSLARTQKRLSWNYRDWNTAGAPFWDWPDAERQWRYYRDAARFHILHARIRLAIAARRHSNLGA